MKFQNILMAAGAALLLSACGDNSPAESMAENLEEAAEQSTPEAAAVLENSADQIEDQNIQDPAAAQQALEAAGNAQAGESSAATNGQ
jgi:hypothetical protein